MDFRSFLNVVDMHRAMGLPVEERTASIARIERNRNPIAIHLSDGTTLSLTSEQYRRAGGMDLAVGKKVKVTFGGNVKKDVHRQVLDVVLA